MLNFRTIASSSYMSMQVRAYLKAKKPRPSRQTSRIPPMRSHAVSPKFRKGQNTCRHPSASSAKRIYNSHPTTSRTAMRLYTSDVINTRPISDINRNVTRNVLHNSASRRERVQRTRARNAVRTCIALRVCRYYIRIYTYVHT